MPLRAVGLFRARIFGLLPGVYVPRIGRLDGFPKIYRRRNTSLRMGDRVRIFPNAFISLEGDEAEINIGSRTFINRNATLVCKDRIVIGDDCAISWDVTITDTDNHSIDGANSTKPVLIGNHVWVGAGSMILKGVVIGDGAIIGARSVVTRDVAARTLVAGSPARVIRENVSWEL